MVSAKAIDDRIKKTIIKGLSEKYLISHPVIRYEDSKFWIASFVLVYDTDWTKTKVSDRPKYYMLADIENGDVISTRKCGKRDFSTASFNKKYSLDMSGVEKNNSDEYYEEAFKLLDEARQAIQETGNPEHYMKPYNKYLKMILANIPKGYRRFYEELSRPTKDTKNIDEFQMPDAPDVMKNDRQRTSDKKSFDRKNNQQGEKAIDLILGSGASKDWEEKNDGTEQNQNQQEKQVDTAIKQKESLNNTEGPEKEDDDDESTKAIDQNKLQSILDEIKKKADKKEKEQKEEDKAEYTYKNIEWTPKEDLSKLPDRYFHIAERISDKIEFLSCDERKLRFVYPLFCFEEDSMPCCDPWQLMQLKVLNTNIKTGHYRTSATDTLFLSCSKKDRCLFRTCPYVIAAYIKYLKLKDPTELEAQRKQYRLNKDETDAEGSPGYIIKAPKAPFSKDKIANSIAFIDAGYFNITRKHQTKDEFVVTYASKNNKPDYELVESGESPKYLTSFSISLNEIENGLSARGFMRRINTDKLPENVDVLIWTDYMIKTGKFEMKKEINDDMVTIGIDT